MKKIEKMMSLILVSSLMISPVSALEKNETVYSKLNSDGSINKTIVSEYLKNNDDVIQDKTNLKNILNINGNEKFKFEGSNLIWDAKGKDIYYQGETEKELPIKVEVSYKLNGKEIELKKLIGKKGKVEITLNYTNIDKHSVYVNGQKTNLYTPFLVTVGTIVKNDNNHNIEVTNGKVVSNGKDSVIIAMASPGLSESLNEEKLKNLDKVTITYDTKKFELNSIYSVVSSKLIEEEDLKIFDKLDNIYSKVNTLSESSKKLVKGAVELEQGASKLSSGIDSLAQGSNKAYLAGKQISDVLDANLGSIDTSSPLSNEQIQNIKTTSLKSTNDSLNSKEAAIKASSKAAYKDGLNTYKAGLSQTINELNCESTSCTQEQLNVYTNAKTTLTVLNSSSVEETLSNISSEVSYQTAKSVTTQVVGGTEEQPGLAVSLADNITKEAKKETVKSLTTLNSAIKELTQGLNQLNEGTKKLETGSITLKEGTTTLKEGMTKFDEEGISKISNLVNGNLKTKEEKIKMLIKLGNAYDTFTMKDENIKGETKFVLVIDSYKK